MTCKKIGVNNRVTNLCVMNCVCVCVWYMYVCVGLYIENDAICLNACSLLYDLSFSQGC